MHPLDVLFHSRKKERESLSIFTLVKSIVHFPSLHTVFLVSGLKFRTEVEMVKTVTPDKRIRELGTKGVYILLLLL